MRRFKQLTAIILVWSMPEKSRYRVCRMSNQSGFRIREVFSDN